MIVSQRTALLDGRIMGIAKRFDALPREMMDQDDFEQIKIYTGMLSSMKVMLIEANDMLEPDIEVPPEIEEIFRTCEASIKDIETALKEAENQVQTIKQSEKSKTAAAFMKLVRPS